MSTVVIKMFTLTVRGIDFRRQILTSKVDPRTVRVNNVASDPKLICTGIIVIVIFRFSLK